MHRPCVSRSNGRGGACAADAPALKHDVPLGWLDLTVGPPIFSLEKGNHAAPPIFPLEKGNQAGGCMKEDGGVSRGPGGITPCLPELNSAAMQSEGAPCDEGHEGAATGQLVSSESGLSPVPDLTLSLRCPSPPSPAHELSMSAHISPLVLPVEASTARWWEVAAWGRTNENHKEEKRKVGQQHYSPAAAPFVASLAGEAAKSKGTRGDGRGLCLSPIGDPPRALTKEAVVRVEEGSGAAMTPDSLGQPGSTSFQEGTASKSSGCPRYLRQKQRDWRMFKDFLKALSPPLTVHSVAGRHVVDFMISLDQFGRTKLHSASCEHYGTSQPIPCHCPLRQACGSLDSLVGRLRAAFEEEGLQGPNPFADAAVKAHLKKVKGEQSLAKGPKRSPAAPSRKRSRTCVESKQEQGRNLEGSQMLTQGEGDSMKRSRGCGEHRQDNAHNASPAALMMFLKSEWRRGASLGALRQNPVLGKDTNQTPALKTTGRSPCHD